MRKIIFVLLFSLIVTATAYSAVISKSPIELRSTMMPIMDSIQQAYNENNYSSMAGCFSETMFKDFPQIDFEALQKKLKPVYGAIKKVEYIGFLNQLDFTIVLYKAQCEKSDMLIRVSLGKIRNKPRIVGLWFG